ncbi:hypothetical protein CLV00_1044 [Flavobacterium sp. 11]|nr:hypothetical protein CLV00_1044 [Flavobacterium sp. 11]
MKNMTLNIIALTTLIILCSMKTQNLDVCEILKYVNKSVGHNYNSEVKFGFETSQSIALDKNAFKLFFEREMSEIDTCYLVGQFKISNNRVGIISYNTSFECDHPINYLLLHVVDNCKIIDTKMIYYQDYDGFNYEISSNLSKKFDILTITEKKFSEYAMEPDAKTDTIFTKIYKINLKSSSLDTIYRKSKAEILKMPHN